LSINDKWPDDTSSSPLRPIYLDYYSRKIAKFTLKFLPYLKKNKYDIVVPTNGGWQSVLVRLATKKLGKKMIVQSNAGIGRDDTVQAWCFPDVYIAISPQGFKWAQKFSWLKTIYIPYGVDLEVFNKTKPINLGLNKPVVLCVAAFLPYKNVELLIKAMQQVTHASLLIIGQGPLEQKLRKLGNELLGSRFKLLTGITHDELISYYKSVQVFSLPSRSSEALGIVNIEAMAAGLPVVAPDDFNRREIIGNAGLFVDPENTRAFAEMIKTALTTDFNHRPQKQAEKFSWDKIVDQYNKLFQSIV
jgi:glycosyltransferase involved in cell wall biosynthesis